MSTLPNFVSLINYLRMLTMQLSYRVCHFVRNKVKTDKKKNMDINRPIMLCSELSFTFN